MNLAFVEITATSSYGGIQTAVWQLSIALARIGHSVTVFGGEGSIRPDFRGQKVAVRTYPFTSRERVPDFGSRFQRIWERISFARRARADFVAGGYDWAIVTKPFDFFWPWMLPAACRTRFALRSGGTDFFPGDRVLARRIDAWFANSHFNAWQIKTRYKRYPRVIYNGVDTGQFSPQRRDPGLRRELGVAEDEVLLVFAGRIVGWKGLGYAVRALARPELTGLPVKLLVIGNGPFLPELKQLAARLGVASRLLFRDAMPHRELPRFYASADLGVFPSIGDEGFSNSIAEVMASGRPVVATSFSGNPETVGNEENCGLLVPPEDPAALADAIRRLASSADLRARMGEAARKRIAELYTWDGVAQRLLAGLQV